MRTEKSFICRGSRWHYIEPSDLKKDWITISRDASQSKLARFGQVVTAIDVKFKELPKKYQLLIKNKGLL
jgi:hypothetical protein